MSRWTTSLKHLAATRPCAWCLAAIAGCLSREQPGTLRVLTYHRVDHVDRRPDLAPQLVSATPDEFVAHLDWIQQRLQPVTLEEVFDAAAGGRPLPTRAVLLTFDDAYEGFDRYAWPPLRSRRIPAVMFVPTAYPDTNRRFWWDDLYAAVSARPGGSWSTPWGDFTVGSPASRLNTYRRLRDALKRLSATQFESALSDLVRESQTADHAPSVMGWDTLRSLQSEGLVLAAHTATHPLMDRIDLESARQELRRSTSDLRAEIGEVPAAFAYPSGHVNTSVRAMLDEEGIRLAFTTRSGLNHLETADPLCLSRFNIGRGTPPSLLAARLSPIAQRITSRSV